MNTYANIPPHILDAMPGRDSERLLRLSEVIRRTGLSRSAVYAGMKNDTFPASVSLGARSVAWTESAIDNWIAERVAASHNLAM